VQQLQEDLEDRKENNKQEPRKRRPHSDHYYDYNRQYGSNHTSTNSTSTIQDVQQRIKDQK